MVKPKTTHVRIDKNLLNELKVEFPDLSCNEAIKKSFYMYKGVQKTGRLIYGKIWKK